MGFLLVAGTLIAYQPAWTGKPIWDDDAHLTRPKLRSFQGLVHIWTRPGATQQYYPLVHSVFWVEHKLWGDSTAGYHLLNILLHATSALLFLGILRQLEVPGACLAAGIFALHPVHAESVAWITELKNTLSGALYLGSALAYLRFDRTRNRGPYVAALGLFVLGLLSKTVIATLPAALLVVFWWKRGRLRWKQDVLPLGPFFLAGIAAGLLTIWVERRFIGARGESFDFSIVERCLIGGRAFWFYLGKLCWPANLVFIYPRWAVSQTVGWQYLFPAAAVAVLAGLWVLARRWRGPLAGLLFFAGTLFPALGFFNVYPFRYSFVADHFQYLASLGIIALAAAGAVMLLGRWRLWGRPGGDAFCLAVLAALACLTWRQCGMYADVETLWQATLARNPDAYLAHNNLGNVLFQKGRVDEAIAHYRSALEIEPGNADTHYNLGNALRQKGQFAQAISHYQRAVEIQPHYLMAHVNLADLLREKGQTDKAIAHLQMAVAIQPDSADAHNNLAWILATCPQGSFRDGARAVALAHEADRLSGGNDPVVIGTLAAANAEAGQFPEAIVAVQRALHLASIQKNTALVNALRVHLRLYQAGSPLRDTDETAAPVLPARP